MLKKLLFLVLTSFLLLSCSKDDVNNSIVGRWDAEYYKECIELNGSIK